MFTFLVQQLQSGKKKMIIYVPTRSTFSMLNVTLKFRDTFPMYKDGANYDCMPVLEE